MSASEIYLFGLVGELKHFCSLLLLISIIVIGVCSLFSPFLFMYHEGEMKVFFKNYFFKAISFLLLIGAIAMFTPSQKVLAAMYIIPAAQQNEDLQEIFGDSLDILKYHMKGWKENLKGGDDE